MVRSVSVLCVLLYVLAMPAVSVADIYQWEWIDPNDHSLGRQESNTLVPDGEGQDAVPGAFFANVNY